MSAALGAEGSRTEHERVLVAYPCSQPRCATKARLRILCASPGQTDVRNYPDSFEFPGNALGAMTLVAGVATLGCTGGLYSPIFPSLSVRTAANRRRHKGRPRRDRNKVIVKLLTYLIKSRKRGRKSPPTNLNGVTDSHGAKHNLCSIDDQFRVLKRAAETRYVWLKQEMC
jgi:hypothetical protein